MRDDSGVHEGATVSRFYDTLLSKLIVWGADRAAACERMARALAEYRIVGVRTTIPILQRIVAHPDFRAGRLSTAFLDRALADVQPNDARYRDIAVVAAVLAAYERDRRAATAAIPTEATATTAWRRPPATWTGR